MADRYVKDRFKKSQLFSIEQIEVLHMLWDSCKEPRCIKDHEGLFVFANAAYLNLFSIPLDSCVTGLSENQLTSSDVKNNAITIVSGSDCSLSSPVTSDASFILKHNDFINNVSEYIYFDKHPLIDVAGQIYGFILHGRKEFILSLNMFSKGKLASKIKTICPAFEITDREWDVVFFLQQNYTFLEISEILGLSQKTISNCIYRLYRKTGSKGYRDFISFCEKWELLNYIPPSLQEHIHL